MSRDENIRIFNEWITAHKAHSITRMVSLLTDDVQIKSAAFAHAKGKKEAAAHWQGIYDTFPDMDVNPVVVTVDEDRIVAEIDFGGTNKGKLGDKPPTGKKFRIRGAFVVEFSGGKIREFRTYYDTAAMMKQLGSQSG